MTRVARRSLLQLGAFGVAELTLQGPVLAALARASGPRSHAPTSRILVVVLQRGGADGLSMLVPQAEPSYLARRPGLGIAPPGRAAGAAIDLDGRFGLHPSLAMLEPFYTARDLCVVHAVGPAVATRSHGDAYHALLSSVARLGGQAGVEVLDEPCTVGASGAPGSDACALAPQLARVAAAVRDVPALRLAVVQSGGWDTHFAQRGRLSGALGGWGAALAAFQRALGPHARRVTLVTLTEFGRSIDENLVGGTDDGAGSVAFVMGASVAGGRVVGRWPGLDGDALRATTPLPALLEEVGAHVFGAPAPASPLGLFTTGRA